MWIQNKMDYLSGERLGRTGVRNWRQKAEDRIE